MIKRVDEQVFQLLSCPRGPAEELEARFDRRFVSEAANINPLGQAVPPVEFLQAKHDLLKRHAVERVVDLFFSHVVIIAYSFGSLHIIASNFTTSMLTTQRILQNLKALAPYFIITINLRRSEFCRIAYPRHRSNPSAQ